MTVPYATLAKSYPYGYRAFYAVEIDGIPFIPHEIAGGVLNSATHTSAGGTLIVDRGAKVGPTTSDTSNIAAALDLEVRLADPEGTSIIAQLMERPTHVTSLSEDVAYNATTLPVLSTLGFESEPLYYGLSCSEFGSSTATSFTSLDASPFGLQHSYKAGLVVANRPRQWQGRRVRLWELSMTPGGVILQGADWKDYATCRWDGYIQSRPVRVNGIWQFNCRDSIRRLSQPLTKTATGTARWSLNSDNPLSIDLNSSFTLSAVQYDSTGATYNLTSYTLQPWAALSNPLRISEIQAALTTAWKAAVIADPDYEDVNADWTWEQIAHEDLGARGRSWFSYVRINLANGGSIRLSVTASGRMDPFRRSSETSYFQPVTQQVDQDVVRTPLVMASLVFDSALVITLDDGDSTVIPPAGWVRLTTEGATHYVRYSSFTVDPTNSANVILEVAEGNPDLDALAAAEGTEAAEVEISAEFVWRDLGLAADVFRRAIASSGYGTNGAHDTLPKGQGYALPNLNADSFDQAFDVAFNELALQLAAEGGTSLEEIAGGLLRLSQRALTTRRAADGSGVEIAAVKVGSADSGVPVATITDADLVATGGQKPVRVKKTFAAPQTIKVTCRTIPTASAEAGEAKITYGDQHLEDWSGEAWDLDIYGIDRAALAAPGAGMALSQFRTGENRFIAEMSTGPHIVAQVGDIVYIDSRDRNLWDYAEGASGYVGLARVLGAPGSLDTGEQVYLIACDGISSAGPMCPSLEIVAVNGTATSPTSIDINEIDPDTGVSLYDLMVWAEAGAGGFYVQIYLPGEDAPHGQYSISGITLPGGGLCRLAVSASPTSPTVTLTTSHRITWPLQPNCTVNQRPYLHNTDNAQWT